MARWRPSFKEEYREKIEDFLEKNPDLPFEEAKDVLEFSANRFITDVKMNQNEVERAREKLKDLQEKLDN